MTDIKDYKDFATIVENIGGKAYFVGGYPRDKFLSLDSHDVDIMITGLSVNQFVEAFPNVGVVGKEFGVFEIWIANNRTEVALARAEKKESIGYKGFQIYTSPEITVEQDLFRRDLTINAIAIHILSNDIVDPYNGLQDLRNGVIKAVSSAFAEDPLRIYRAARFAARFGFTIEETTIEMMNSLKSELIHLSVERVVQELTSALQTKKPSLFFESLRQADVLDVHFKEVNDLFGVPQPPKYHPEGDAYTHTLMVMDIAASIPNNDTKAVFVALVHDLGKALTPADILPRHPGHELAGVPLVHELATRLKLPKQWENAGAFGAEHHGKVHRINEMRSVKIVDLINSAKRSALGVEGLVNLAIADAMDKDRPIEHRLITWDKEIAQVKGNPELAVANIAEDKRVRQAKLLDSLR